jgi:hypothetical protein
VIIERDTATVVGDIGFIGPPGPDGLIEVGYSVIRERRRLGYATEAARAIIDWAHRQPGVRTVVAGCDKDNVPSIRTLETTRLLAHWRKERPAPLALRQPQRAGLTLVVEAASCLTNTRVTGALWLART